MLHLKGSQDPHLLLDGLLLKLHIKDIQVPLRLDLEEHLKLDINIQEHLRLEVHHHLHLQGQQQGKGLQQAEVHQGI